MTRAALGGLAIALAVAATGCNGCDRGLHARPSADPETEAPVPFTGPLPASATPDAKAAEVYRLLAGGRAARALPERSVDEGASFDRQLKDRVAPGTSTR